MDIVHISGIFTVPVSGTWRVTFSLKSSVNLGLNWAFLYLNGHPLSETLHRTKSPGGWINFTSGREVTLEASAGDTIEIRVDQVENGHYENIYLCVDYIPKM